jgi:hypothetical protein
MNGITVQFTGVGRDKKSWRETFPSLRENLLIQSIRNHSALMSHDIEFEDGVIFVGGFRAVGNYEIIREEATL